MDATQLAAMKLPCTLFGEALLFSFIALALSLTANAVHPTGLDLSRDYFPTVLENPYGKVSLADAVEYSQYIGDEVGGITFLDARKSSTYEAGHIPGARTCDHYQQEKYVPGLLPVLKNAAMIIIYCNGGTCEDSLFLANDLIYQYDIPHESVFVFEEGFNAWRAAGHPIQKGPKE